MRFALVVVLALAVAPRVSFAQETHDTHESPAAAAYTCPMHPDVHANEPGSCPICGMALVEAKSKPADEPEHAHADHMKTFVPLSREASGTAWQPDTTPVYGHHFMHGAWMTMLHYHVQAGWIDQQSDRGGRMAMSANWVMAMARRGNFQARAMLSLEPLTIPGYGYPLLLQSGETWNGEPLHDTQHPHDLLMEAAVSYTQPIAKRAALFVYGGPAGEPAIGPPGFPHRYSASGDPLAPIGHHWQDSTHITYGVVTGGAIVGDAKIEGSWFNGREPDENRWDVDLRELDSWAARFSVMPAEWIVLQASYAHLGSPHELEPEEAMDRRSMSLTLQRKVGAGHAGALFSWGHNIHEGHPASDSYLAEVMWDADGRNTVFGRAEHVEKTAHDLVLSHSHAGGDEALYALSSFVLGYLREQPFGPVVLGAGIRGNVSFLPAELEEHYGSVSPYGGMVFLRLRPRPQAH